MKKTIWITGAAENLGILLSKHIQAAGGGSDYRGGLVVTYGFMVSD